MANFSNVDAGGNAGAPAAKDAGGDKTWSVKPSEMTKFRPNPIRAIVDNIASLPRNMDKSLIPLSYGDPTMFGNLNLPEVLTDAVVANAKSLKHNGYLPMVGSDAAREAVAQAYSPADFPVTKDDVVMTHGGVGAISLAIMGLANRGDNVLLPSPGFSYYEVLCEAYDVEFRFYNLQPENAWEADLTHMQSLIDDRTKAIVVINPGNPSASVYSKEHLKDILAVADTNKVPVIADEIYGDMVFGDAVFHPMASLSTTVPVIEVSGMAKHFLVPGWRVGWLIVHDRAGVLEQARLGFRMLAQLRFAPNSLVLSAVPAALTPTPGSPEEKALAEFKTNYYATLESNAELTASSFTKTPGLESVKPQGTMYAMLKIDPSAFSDIEDDVMFATKLLQEESIVVLPGQCFGISNYMRILIAPPQPILKEAFERMDAFCQRHAKL